MAMITPQFAAAREQYRLDKAAASRAAVLAAVVNSHVALTATETATAAGVHRDTATKYLRILTQDGLLEQDGKLFAPATLEAMPASTKARKRSKKNSPVPAATVARIEAAVRARGEATIPELTAELGVHNTYVRRALKQEPTIFVVLREKQSKHGAPTKVYGLVNAPAPPAVTSTAAVLQDELSLFSSEELIAELFGRLRRNVLG